ncbi:hypothetical protein C8R47DRAFT_1070627 [Mycena vitilis]|nr:hypothetical protein C8R47DRAFT_1070627 [Mycena vitilis]
MLRWVARGSHSVSIDWWHADSYDGTRRTSTDSRKIRCHGVRNRMKLLLENHYSHYTSAKQAPASLPPDPADIGSFPEITAVHPPSEGSYFARSIAALVDGDALATTAIFKRATQTAHSEETMGFEDDRRQAEGIGAPNRGWSLRPFAPRITVRSGTDETRRAQDEHKRFYEGGTYTRSRKGTSDGGWACVVSKGRRAVDRVKYGRDHSRQRRDLSDAAASTSASGKDSKDVCACKKDPVSWPAVKKYPAAANLTLNNGRGVDWEVAAVAVLELAQVADGSKELNQATLDGSFSFFEL